MVYNKSVFADIDGDNSAQHAAYRTEDEVVQQRQPENKLVVERRKNDEGQRDEYDAANKPAQPAVVRFFEREYHADENSDALYYLIDDRYRAVRNREYLDGKRRE